jgi:hypothetical protein
MRLVIIKWFFLIVFLCLFLSSSFSKDVDVEDFLFLHTNPDGKPMGWFECGKRIRDREKRAREYSDALFSSIEDVKEKTGFEVDYDIARAILFRESTDDQCAIGKQETRYLSKSLGYRPKRRDLLKHVGGWLDTYRAARSYCRGMSSDEYRSCRMSKVKEINPHYAGIRGWDIGVAQYRWPSAITVKRSVNVPGESKVHDVNLDNLMKYKISIQMLISDLASHYEECKRHKHWTTKKNGFRIRLVPTEIAYYVHHHTGIHSWSQGYWRRVQRHLKKMKTREQ